MLRVGGFQNKKNNIIVRNVIGFSKKLIIMLFNISDTRAPVYITTLDMLK